MATNTKAGGNSAKIGRSIGRPSNIRYKAENRRDKNKRLNIARDLVRKAADKVRLAKRTAKLAKAKPFNYGATA